MVYFIHLFNNADEYSNLVQEIWKRKLIGFTASTYLVTKDVLEIEKLVEGDLNPENYIFFLYILSFPCLREMYWFILNNHEKILFLFYYYLRHKILN